MEIPRREILRWGAMAVAGMALSGCAGGAEEEVATDRPTVAGEPTTGPRATPTSEPTHRPTSEATATSEVERRPSEVRGVYLPFYLLDNRPTMEWVLGKCESWGVNSLVVDIKDELGRTNVPFEHPWRVEMSDRGDTAGMIRELIDWAGRNGIHLVARQVVMTDNIQVEQRSELAFRLADGRVREDNSGNIWLGPEMSEQIGDYNAAVARGAVELGFKEIQLDYIRLPEALFYIPYEDRVAAIGQIVEKIGARVRPTGALLTADLFGRTAVTQEFEAPDMGIGQDISVLGRYLDGICPMVYPSLHADPDFSYLAEVVRGAIERLARVNPEGFVNPWIQAYAMDGRQVVEQTRMAVAAGAVGVFAWNNNLTYPDEMFNS